MIMLVTKTRLIVIEIVTGTATLDRGTAEMMPLLHRPDRLQQLFVSSSNAEIANIRMLMIVSSLMTGMP